MAKNILVVSCDVRETRAALIEDGIIAELHIERKGAAASTVGNVYVGKVTRVLPGLQAAFIDIGQERAAFLHVEDLIRPDDFDAYLAGGRKHARDETRVVEDEAEVDEVELEAPGDKAPITAVSPEGLGVVPAADPSELDLGGRAVLPALASQVDLSSSPDLGDASGPDVTLEASGSSPVVAPPASSSGLVDELSQPALPEDSDLDEAPDSDEAVTNRASDDVVDVHARETLVTPEPRRGRSQPPQVKAVQVEVVEVLEAGAADPSSSDEDDDESVEASDADQGDQTDQTEQDDRVEAEGEEVDEDWKAPADDDLFTGDLPGFTVSDPGEPVPRAPSPARAADRDRGGRGRRRGRGRGRNDRPGQAGGGGGAEARGGSPAGGGGGERGGDRGGDRGKSGGRGRGGDRGGSGGHAPNRISKSTPIREVVREGQEIIVQVTKDPIGTKGARCSSHISLPGRYVVYLPTVEHVGISKRIGSEKERARLREAIEGMKPPSGGLIVRTVAEGLTKKQLKQDVGYLVRLWGEIAKKKETAGKAPNLLMSELDLVLKVARDLFTDEVEQVVVDDRYQYERLCRFVEMFAPDRVKDVVFYDEEEPIFDEYGISDEIGRALSRKVPLPSGGYLIIDQAEALTAIDVNTGRFVGKGSKDMEETILKTNLEAVNEIAYQLRFRNIGGLIILDLIDMEKSSNREKVRRTLEDLLQKDKAKTTLNRISELGLIEMTRKRTRESLGRLLHEPCFYCDGTGQLQSKETIAYEILREIRRKRSDLPGYSVVVNAHPAVADVLNGSEKEAVVEAENRFMRKIHVVPRKEYHLEQFDIAGK
jgi:ribonuclease G